MTAAIAGRPSRRPTERDAYLTITAVIWVGVLLGFGIEIAGQWGHVYPPILHLHAAIMVSWLVLFTAQVTLVRTGRQALHRRIGPWMAVLAALVVIVGPIAAIHMDRVHFEAHGDSPAFMAVQLSDMLAFGTLTGAALLLRKTSAWHKRLMLLGTLYISDAGWARLTGDTLEGAAVSVIGHGYWSFFAGAYGSNIILVLVFGVWDFATNRRLHPAWLAGAGWTLIVMLTASWLYFDPAWKVVAMRAIGH